jgi:WD40 repeat protein
MRSTLTLILLALLAAPAFGQDKLADNKPLDIVKLERTDAVLYEKEIHPIFKNKCFACHSGSMPEGRFDLSSYDSLIKGGKRGSPIVPGKSGDSLLVKLCSRTLKPFMPPKGEPAMTPVEFATVKLWIDQGARAPTGEIAVAKITIGLLPASVTPIRAVAISPDKTLIVAGRGNQILVYDAAKGDFLRALVAPNLTGPDGNPVQAAHLSLVEAMAFSPDGKWLATGSFEEVALWDVKTGKLENKLMGFAHNVVALAFSTDGKFLATGGGVPTADGEIKVFETGSWNLVTDIKGGHSDTVFGVSISPDSKLIATGGADKFVKVFELPSGKFVKSFEGHTHHVMDVGWKPDGKLLASAGADNAIKIWNYETGEQVKTVQAHGKQITRLQFIGKTNQFATSSGDSFVKFWNVDQATVARNFPGSSDFLYAVSVSADGQLVVSGGQEGVVRVYNGANGQLVRTLKQPEKK